MLERETHTERERVRQSDRQTDGGKRQEGSYRRVLPHTVHLCVCACLSLACIIIIVCVCVCVTCCVLFHSYNTLKHLTHTVFSPFHCSPPIVKVRVLYDIRYPSEGMSAVMKAVCLLRGLAAKKSKDPRGGFGKVDDWWKTGRAMLNGNQRTFLNKLGLEVRRPMKDAY